MSGCRAARSAGEFDWRAAGAAIAPGELPAVADALTAKIDQYADRWGLAAHRRIPLGPIVDGSTLPADPWEALAGGAARDVDLIAGHMRHEQRLLSLIEGLLGQITEDQAATGLNLFAPGPAGVAQYRDGGGSPDELYDRVHSDWLFRMPSLHLAEAHTGRTYVYEVTWPAPGMGGILGACHELDVPLVFGNLTSGQPAMLLGDDLTDAEVLSTQMRNAWTTFATNGNPGWPEYDPQERVTRVFDSEPTVVPYPEEMSRRIWQDHTFTTLPLKTRSWGGAIRTWRDPPRAREGASYRRLSAPAVGLGASGCERPRARSGFGLIGRFGLTVCARTTWNDRTGRWRRSCVHLARSDPLRRRW